VSPARPTILLVEDDAPTAYMMTDVLESTGYQVHVADTGAAARSMAEQLPRSLFILDLILRCAVPVGHHVRVRWYELPASCSTRRTVLVPTCGNPDRRSVRCSVLSDQVAVPSIRRSGARCAVATIFARALDVYVAPRPRPLAIPTAERP